MEIRKFLIPLFALFIFLVLPLFSINFKTQADSFLGDKHTANGLTCASCHKEDPPQKSPPGNGCLTCHSDQEKLVQRTNKVIPNPHASPHLDPGAPLVCDECHHMHKPSKPSCIACHQDFKFRNI
jgi:hypothetical protein